MTFKNKGGGLEPTKLYVVEKLNMEIWISYQSQLSELNKEEISQRTNTLSVPDIGLKIKVKNAVWSSNEKEKMFITYLIQIFKRTLLHYGQRHI